MNWFALIWLLISVILPLPSALADSEAKRQEAEALQERIGRLKETLAQTRGQKEQLLSELEASERAVGRVAKVLRRLEADLVKRDAKLKRLQADRTALESTIADQRHTLAGYLRNAYFLGRQERVKLLLNQEDPGRLGRIMAYHQYLSQARADGIRDIQLQAQELRRLESAVTEEQVALRQLRGERQAERDQLAAERNHREKLMAELEKALKQQGAQLAETKRDLGALQKVIKRLDSAEFKAEADARKPMAGEKGKLVWPVKGRLSARFGTKRSGGTVWDGVVISAKRGVDVKAVYHGRVAFADWLRGFGLLVILDHGDGYMSLYGFNQTLLKETGEWVEAGEPIAQVGDSGGRAHAGLYFGIRSKGAPRNPRKWCRRLKGSRTG